jgi:hypothetical protein
VQSKLNGLGYITMEHCEQDATTEERGREFQVSKLVYRHRMYVVVGKSLQYTFSIYRAEYAGRSKVQGKYF